MRTQSGDNIRLKSRRLAHLKNKTAELERELSDARLTLERELAEFGNAPEAASDRFQEMPHWAPWDAGREHDPHRMSAPYTAPRSTPDLGGARYNGQANSPKRRTEIFVNHGRRSAYYHSLSRRRKVAIGTAVVAVIVAIVVMIMSSRGASWPPSVATVQSEAAKACQNPDVRSEPGQVNFACAQTTRQILWVFALMTSANDPNFVDARTGRRGLEPITPQQGGEMAWSLNLHHPYNPADPIDSIEVAARAINNIIGGATLIGADGKLAVQPGLESNSANCARYTGSAAIRRRKGFPSLCARAVTSAAGQAALVADVYRKWVVGAPPGAAQDAATLFDNAKNPGDPRVQAILRQLSESNLTAKI